jgi:hypothetical protein
MKPALFFLLVTLAIITVYIIYDIYSESSLKNKNTSKPEETVTNCTLDIQTTECNPQGTYTSTVTVLNTAHNIDCVYKNTVLENTTGYRLEFTNTCPVDCVLGTTYSYGPCDGSSRKRTRLGDIQALNGGYECPPVEDTETCGDCILGTAYSAWGSCNGSTRSRTRSGDLQAFNGGRACPSTTETQSCSHCILGTTYNYSACDGSTRTRVRLGDTGPVNGGNACPNIYDTQSCSHCILGTTYNYSACNGSTRTRVRLGDTGPVNGGNACPSTTDTQVCRHCQLGSTFTYGSCNGSTRTRSRSGDTGPLNGGNACPSTEDTQACNHCVLSDWGEWSRCSNWTSSSIYSRRKTVSAIATNGGVCSVDNITGTIASVETLNCENILLYSNLTSCTQNPTTWMWTCPTGSGSGILPYSSWTTMTIEMVGGGGSGGWGSYYGSYFAGGGGGGAGEGKTIVINYDPIYRGMSFNYTLGLGGNIQRTSVSNDWNTLGKGMDTTFTINGQTYTAKGGQAGGSGVIVTTRANRQDIGVGGSGGGTSPPSTTNGKDGTKNNVNDLTILFGGGDGGNSIFGNGGKGSQADSSGAITAAGATITKATLPTGYGAGGGGGIKGSDFSDGKNGAIRIRFSSS